MPYPTRTAGGGVSPNGASAGGKEDAPANGGPAPRTPRSMAYPRCPPTPSAPRARPSLRSLTRTRPPGARPQPVPGGRLARAELRPAAVRPAGRRRPDHRLSRRIHGRTSGAGPCGPRASGLAQSAPSRFRPAPSGQLARRRPSRRRSPRPRSPGRCPTRRLHSPSSPARTFLRSGTSGKNPPAPQAAPPSGGPDKAAAGRTRPRRAARGAEGIRGASRSGRHGRRISPSPGSSPGR